MWDLNPRPSAHKTAKQPLFLWNFYTESQPCKSHVLCRLSYRPSKGSSGSRTRDTMVFLNWDSCKMAGCAPSLPHQLRQGGFSSDPESNQEP